MFEADDLDNTDASSHLDSPCHSKYSSNTAEYCQCDVSVSPVTLDVHSVGRGNSEKQVKSV
jgi:hypothetical protein